MSPLVTDKQMTAIRGIAEKGMITTVGIYRRSGSTPSDPDEDYGDGVTYTETTPTRRGTVQGWLRTVPASQAEIDAGAIITDTVWELRVPYGTDIAAGDEVQIASEEYDVVAVDDKNTLLPYIKCSLRKPVG